MFEYSFHSKQLWFNLQIKHIKNGYREFKADKDM